ncbi:accessory factor associated with RNA polymerase II [Kappamyces sp. JEL0829]|nr:accessory factor associated with RNA polymerase II [Kappamyces sp. JEL0829]
MLFVTALRQSIQARTAPLYFQTDKKPCSDLAAAHSIGLESEVWKVTDASGYKSYDVLSILFFYLKKDLDHPSYLQTCASSGLKGLSSITFMDRRDLLDYLTGVSESSSNLTGEGSRKDVSQPAAAPGPKSDEAALFGFDLPKKRAALPDSTREDVKVMKKLREFTRTINNPSNILCVKGTKTFANVEKPAFSAFMSTNVKKLGSAPVSSSKSSKDKAKSSGKSTARHLTAVDDKEPYIIIVPAAVTSLLTLENVKEFLIDQKFVSTEDIRKNGEKKPLAVSLTRDPKKLAPGAHGVFKVVDSIEGIKGKWDRIVAVFCTGQEWQFKGWKWEKPVDIFSRATSLLQDWYLSGK